MSLLLSPPRNFALGQSLQPFEEYRASERSQRHFCGTSTSGELLEYETLALRLAPPAVEISNSSASGRTTLTISSANRSGTLVEVVQGLTELGLEVLSARISSDGGWFVDVFEIAEANGQNVHDPQKLSFIQSMLDVHKAEEDLPTRPGREASCNEATVLELAGQDRAGLLADITDLMTANACHVCSAAVWTYAGRVAFVLSVTDNNQPISEAKHGAMKGRLLKIMSEDGDAIVRITKAGGQIHHDRRLHQLMLLEASKAYIALPEGSPRASSQPVKVVAREDRPNSIDSKISAFSPSAFSPTDSVSSLYDGVTGQDYRSPKYSAPVVKIQKCSDRKYWLVNIECKDRNKLLFDTVCTLADMNYDVFHASIDSVKGRAFQEYYIRARHGCTEWCDAKANLLRGMLEASIQRRFPQGLKVHVRELQNGGCLTELASRLRAANLSITRAKVRPYSKISGQTLYLMGVDGSPPDPAIVEEACCNLGGLLVDRAAETDPQAHSGEQKFTFSFLERQFTSGWGLQRTSLASSIGSSNNSITSMT